MKRKTKNVCLLEVIKRQEREIKSLLAQIARLEELERNRDDAWNKYTDDRIREINIAIRSSK